MNPIVQISQTFGHELKGDTTTWALGNVTSKKVITTEISVQNYAISDTDNPFVFNNSDGFIGAGWITDPQDQFKNFNVGDTVIIFNQADSTYQTGTIAAKDDDGTIQISGVTISGGINFSAVGYVISVTTEITSIKYHHNFIENGAAPTFISPVDGSEQIWVIENKLASDTSTSNMVPLGSPCWQSGSVEITGVAIDPGTTDGVYKSTYTIVHTTYIPGWILQAQLENQIANPPVNPNDFATINNCWGFIYQIEALPFYTDPNALVSVVFNESIGNTGWFGENFSTEKTNYSISNLAYTNASNPTPSIHLDASTTTIDFEIVNTTDTPFSAATKCVIGIMKVPSDPSEYQNNGELLINNFLLNRHLIQANHFTSGDDSGAANEVISSITLNYIDSGHLSASINTALSAGAITGFNESSTPRYLIFVEVQNQSESTDESDNVVLIVDLNEFTIVTSDPGMIVFDKTVFLRHPEADPDTEGVEVETVPGVEPTPLQWEIAVSGGSQTGILIYDSGGVLVIGVADWTTNFTTTMNRLVTSINTNTQLGTMFRPGSTFSNAAGYTAAWDGTNFTLTPPLGSYASIDGDQIYLMIPIFDTGWVITGGTFGTDGSHENFYYQPWAGGVNPIDETFDCYPQDEVVIYTEFHIESSGRTITDILITNINAQIMASNGTDEFELDQFNLPLKSIGLTGDTQQFDIQSNRVFNVPVGSIRKVIQAQRRNDLDTGTKYYFSTSYPIMIRWETWVEWLNVDPSFFNPALPNNGFNAWWYQYGQKMGWSLYYKLTIQATESGNAQQYETQVPFIIHDYNSDAAYTLADAMTFNAGDLSKLQSGTGGAKQLVSGGTSYVTIHGQKYYTNGQGMVYTDRQTLIAALFTKTSEPVNYYVEIDVEVYDSGGIVGTRMLSSKWVTDGNTWFTSIDGSGKVVLAEYGDTVLALALLDPSDPNFPSGAVAYSISPRIYEIGGDLETDDSVPLDNDNGIQLEVD